MSRTYRRKNYEDTQRTSWDNRGRKQSGYYNKDVYVKVEWWNDYYKCWHGISVRNGQTVPLDDREFYKRYWRIHNDTVRYWKGPNAWWRRHCNKRMRCNARHELHKFVTREDYDPVFKTRDSAFDWWYYD